MKKIIKKMQKIMTKIWPKMTLKNLTDRHDSAQISEIREIGYRQARDMEMDENEYLLPKT